MKRWLEATGLAANEGNFPAFQIFAVTDFEPYLRLFHHIVESSLVNAYRESDITLFGDWWGDIYRDYGVRRDDWSHYGDEL